jgi:hypothetical protein
LIYDQWLHQSHDDGSGTVVLDVIPNLDWIICLSLQRHHRQSICEDTISGAVFLMSIIALMQFVFELGMVMKAAIAPDE